MSDELQKEIDRLKSENAKLARDLAGAHEDLKEVRGEARDRRHEGKKLAEQLDALTKERDELKVKAQADPEGLKSKLADAQGKLREVNHRSVFAKVAAGLKVTDPTKVSDLYALSGYKPEDEQADESKLAEVIQAALKGRPHFLDGPAPAAGAAQNASGGATGANAAQLGGKPGVGAERGQSVTSESKSTPPGRIPGRL
jgi:hypothetical protein